MTLWWTGELSRVCPALARWLLGLTPAPGSLDSAVAVEDEWNEWKKDEIDFYPVTFDQQPLLLLSPLTSPHLFSILLLKHSYCFMNEETTKYRAVCLFYIISSLFVAPLETSTRMCVIHNPAVEFLQLHWLTHTHTLIRSDRAGADECLKPGGSLYRYHLDSAFRKNSFWWIYSLMPSLLLVAPLAAL